jgi:GNAT superfamily N-acetyltransferase
MMQKSDLIFSPLLPAHIDQMEQIEKECFSVPWSREALEEELDNPCAHYVVCTDPEGNVMGYIGSRVVLDGADITNVAVRPQCRRQGIGLLLVGVSLILMVCLKKKSCVFSAAPVALTSSMPFIMMMVVGLGGMCASLSIVACKMKKGKVMILFILSFVCAMAMGYMSSRDSTLAWVNWAEQSINTVSQLCLLLGTAALHKAGLKDYNW